MAQELTAEKTVVPREEVLRALWGAWLACFGEVPKKESIWILLSQWALETGWGKSMWNFNLGNVKSRDGDGYDYCFFACNEIFKTSVAQSYQKNNPDTAKITANRADGTSIIWFYPKHPACRFRAFRTLLDGAVDHLSIVHKRFSRSWPAVLAGDPAQYSHMLRAQGYYTADEAQYTKTLVSVYNTIAHMAFDYSTLPTSPEMPELDDDQKDRIQNLVALTMQQSLEDLMYGSPSSDDEEDGPAVA